MKKIYQAPSTFAVKLCATKMLALSYIDSEQINTENRSNYVQDVKGDRNNYNVWDDDWSQ